MSKKSDLTNYISICEINAPNISVYKLMIKLQESTGVWH